MNPLTNVRNLAKINERELNYGVAGDDRRSWHAKYRDSAWIFVGGLPYDLSEGDVVCVFSQYGEIVNINLIRDKKTGKSRGFCFVCYEDQRSTVLAVDNLNGTKLLGRTLRVDHVENYRVPKEHEDMDEETKQLFMEGCAPDIMAKKGKIHKPPDSSEESRNKEAQEIRDKSRETQDVRDDRKYRHKEEDKPRRRRTSEEEDESRRRKHEKRHRHDEDRSKRHHHKEKKVESKRRRRDSSSERSSDEDSKRYRRK